VPYLLDTDVISSTMWERPAQHVVQRLAAVSADEQFTSAITYAELLYGARRRRSARLEGLVLSVTTRMGVLPFDEASADVFGHLKAELERAGTPLAEPDLRIASIAIANSLTLVSGNERHFRRVPGLTFENWLEEIQ
jgi:tRNA(fMet)-specific endonuclease VapC